MEEEEVRPFVVDLGSSVCRVGLAGEGIVFLFFFLHCLYSFVYSLFFPLSLFSALISLSPLWNSNNSRNVFCPLVSLNHRYSTSVYTQVVGTSKKIRLKSFSLFSFLFAFFFPFFPSIPLNLPIDVPQAIIPMVVGTPKKGKGGEELKSRYIGRDAQEREEILSLSWPVCKGVVTNWDNLEAILWHSLSGTSFLFFVF